MKSIIIFGMGLLVSSANGYAGDFLSHQYTSGIQTIQVESGSTPADVPKSAQRAIDTEPILLAAAPMWNSKTTGFKSVATTTSSTALAPNLSTTPAFVAIPPYKVKVLGVDRIFDLGNRQRVFDFGGSVPFVNPTTATSDIATFNVWNQLTIPANSITNAGVAGRVEKSNGLTMVKYVAGDGIVAGKARTQINTYPVPTRTRVAWDLEVAFGSNDPSSTWQLTPEHQSPVLFWELKSYAAGNPSLSAVVDTNAADGSSLKIIFFEKGGKSTTIKNLGTVTGIARNQFVPIKIVAYLDERETSAGGLGNVKIWVSDTLVIDTDGPTIQYADDFHRWVFGAYLYNEAAPYAYSRATYWRKAKMVLQ